MGNVLQAGQGQAPTRQAALGAGKNDMTVKEIIDNWQNCFNEYV